MNNGFQLAADLRTESRWLRFARALVEQTPVRSMLSFRLFLTEDNRAALNLYATRPGAFTDQSTATGSTSPHTPRWHWSQPPGTIRLTT